MTQTQGLRPTPGDGWPTDDTPPPAPPADDRNGLERFVDFLVDTVPAAWWPYLTGGLLLSVVITWPWAKRQAYIAGQLSVGKRSRDRKTDALLVAAMIPAILFWLAVMFGSFKGLIAFGRDDLNWRDGSELLVPATLDGVSIAFGFLAFRAIKTNRSPDRCNAMVKGAAFASALINFVHEVNLPDGTWLGGSYLALLSVLGVVMFHEFLDQFGDGNGTVRRAKPHFGLRWATMFPNTFCAWLAWQNYPPTPLRADADDDHIAFWGSVKHAIAHLEEVRVLKRQKQRDNDLLRAERGEQWWHRIAPWARIRQLNALRAEQAEHARLTLAEQAERFEAALAEQTERLKAEHTERVETALAEQAERLRAAMAEQAERIHAEHRSIAEQLNAEQAEHARLTLAEQAERFEAERRGLAERLEAEHTERVETALAEQAERFEATLAVQAERLEAEHTERVKAALAEQAERLSVASAEQLRAALAEQTERLNAEQAERRSARRRNGHQPPTEHPEREQAEHGQPGIVTPFRDRRTARMERADLVDLAKLFAEHPRSDFEWGTREIRRLTGAGFGTRGQRLLERVEEHIRSCGEGMHDTCFRSLEQDAAADRGDVRAAELVTVGG
ncbi:DUF2637 domain-containing protein [Micromonospora sp. C51]|uniref:DUF2637 domain-containing protein n=1 Tax=Micromonospora sp. C51 TaxID=2824879 RepID=UPI001B369543|nr:DUF2637 domain-containing protein [Micromonospora sp. C51]MBQ1048491.1 DUF2637 domain-containing protein [Micromonospora sp. C51]